MTRPGVPATKRIYVLQGYSVARLLEYLGSIPDLEAVSARHPEITLRPAVSCSFSRQVFVGCLPSCDRYDSEGKLLLVELAYGFHVLHYQASYA